MNINDVCLDVIPEEEAPGMEDADMELSPSLSKYEKTPVSQARMSIDNLDRPELMWTAKNETFIKDWMKMLKEKIALHNESGEKYKIMYRYMSIPAIVLPVIMSSFLEEFESHTLILKLILIFLGVFQGITKFVNPAKRSETHFQFEAKYNAVLWDLKLEIVKPKPLRTACDIVLHKNNEKITQLQETEPFIKNIPKKR